MVDSSSERISEPFRIKVRFIPKFAEFIPLNRINVLGVDKRFQLFETSPGVRQVSSKGAF